MKAITLFVLVWWFSPVPVPPNRERGITPTEKAHLDELEWWTDFNLDQPS